MDMKYNWIPKGRCMVKKMNKQEFINELQSRVELSKDECIIINEILEKHFILGSKNKVVRDLKESLNIEEIKADEIYNISMEIISSSLKQKLKNPFKSID